MIKKIISKSKKHAQKKNAKTVTFEANDSKTYLVTIPSSSSYLCDILATTEPRRDVLTKRVRLGQHEMVMVPVKVPDSLC